MAPVSWGASVGRTWTVEGQGPEAGQVRDITGAQAKENERDLKDSQDWLGLCVLGEGHQIVKFEFCW